MAANDAMRTTWTEAGIGWVEHERVFDAVFSPVTQALLTRAGVGPGHRVLDVGCGSGTLLAAGVEAGAEVVGIDISPAMVEGARRRVPSGTVVLADAQETDLLAMAPGRAFDRVVSRFGVMFFDDPVAAFGRLRSATAADGRLVFACWRSIDENPMFTLGTSVLTDRLPPTSQEPATAPGPASLADPAHLESVLTSSGWGLSALEPFDFTCDYTSATSDGVEERLATILATSSGRRVRVELEPEIGADGWASLLDDVRAVVAEQRVDGGVRFPAATWLVTAQPS